MLWGVFASLHKKFKTRQVEEWGLQRGIPGYTNTMRQGSVMFLKVVITCFFTYPVPLGSLGSILKTC